MTDYAYCAIILRQKMTNAEFDRLLKQKGDVIIALIEALRECEVEIDMMIEREYPPEESQITARLNCIQRKQNPARIALDAYDAGREM